MTIKELIKQLNNLNEEDKEKDISINVEPYCGVYLCTKEGQNKVRPIIELQDLSK